MKYFLSLKNEDLSRKVCLLRVDLNIENELLKIKPLPLRLAAVLPTLKFLINKKAKVLILSHRGRPKLAKQVNSEFRIQNSEFTLKPFVKILSSLIGKPVGFIGLKELGFINKTKRKIQNSAAGSVFLTENLRYFNGEEKNDKNFAKRLASLGDFFVNDAFGVSHRANASVSGITKFLPSYAGFQIEKEIKNLSLMMKNPKRPLVVILGGAKISDKIGLIKNFFAKADYFLIGGGMANTFLAAQDLPVGESLYEKETVSLARRLLKSKKIVLPVDLTVEKRKILDIGPKTIEKYSKIINNAKTIIWNGPMGYFEDCRFAKGSEAMAKVIIKSRAYAVIGGGETTALIQNSKFNPLVGGPNSRIFLSTGGGAMLEYLAGKKLPGIKALK